MGTAGDLLDLVQESVIIRSSDGIVRAWNKASEALYGWAHGDAEGRPIHDLLKTRRETIAPMEAALRDGPWEGDVVRRRADGVLITVQVKCVRREGDIVETGIDVSAQRRIEDALNRAEHRYYNVFQAMAVSFWELDFTPVGAMVQRLMRDGHDLKRYFADNPAFVRDMIRATRVIDINDQSVQLLGRGDKEEMLASLEPYWPPESQHVYAESVLAAIAGKPHYATETRLSSIDGREFDVWFTACFPPEMLARGKLLIGIIDISADKKAKTALETSERRYRRLFHFLPVAMVQLDRTELGGVFAKMKADGVDDLLGYFDAHPGFYDYAANSIRVVEANRRAAELFSAKDEAELIGPAARLWSESGGLIRQSMAARYSGASRFESEMKIRTFDGQIRDVLYVAFFPEAFDEKAIGLSCLVDISDRVQAQAMLAKVQAEFAHAARVSMLGELTASIAHEVNQPLGAILTNGEAALRWLSRPEPDLTELRALSTRTVSDAHRAADIIRRIRSMATRGQPEQEPLGLNGVVEDVMLFLQPELRRQNVEAILQLAADLPDVVGDRVQLQQVFANLAVNAMHAMTDSERHRLTIRTFSKDERTICAEVTDTGPGIAAEHMPQLFQSFFTTKGGGMGIGLAICQSIVEAHGGRIEAENAANGGACFRFTLPVHTGV
ncbi:MAG: ATP-binding protein [Rhizomicrobium sp.]